MQGEQRQINGPGERGCGQGGGQRSQQDLLMERREEQRQDLGLGPKTWCGVQNNGPQRYPYYLQTSEYASGPGKRDLHAVKSWSCRWRDALSGWAQYNRKGPYKRKMEAGGSSKGRRCGDQNRGRSDAGQGCVETEQPLEAGKGRRKKKKKKKAPSNFLFEVPGKPDLTCVLSK